MLKINKNSPIEYEYTSSGDISNSLNFLYKKDTFKLTLDSTNLYIYLESDTFDCNRINILLSNRNKKQIQKIFELNNLSKNDEIIELIISEFISKTSDNIFLYEFSNQIDTFGIFREYTALTKVKTDYSSIQEKMLNYKTDIENNSFKNIPKKLLYTKNQIIDIIINEMKQLNNNFNHTHYIEESEISPYTFIVSMNISNWSSKDMLKLQINFNPVLHPFFPPTISLIYPSVKSSLVFSLSNLNILKIKNWNPTISLDWLINNLSIELTKIHLEDYLIEKSVSSILENTLDEFKQKMVIFSGNELDEIKINLEYTKYYKSISTQDNKYWNSGVGFGNYSRETWDINNFIKDKDIQIKEITKLLKLINDNLNEKSEEKIKNILVPFISDQVLGTTMLEIDTKIELFSEVIKSIFKLSQMRLCTDQYLYDIFNELSILKNDINIYLVNISTNQNDENDEKLSVYFQIIDLANYLEKVIKDYIIKQYNQNTNITSNNDDYIKMIKEEQNKIFDPDFKITSSHLFYKELSNLSNAKSIFRISSDFSSFRQNLPATWDSSIIVKVNPNSLNVFSFIITGPKDTPYHNGIFEFHACFPSDYPSKQPKVLLETTGEGSVRFNPNLYNCGKVCLSLLGTWSGAGGETWNEKTSTFLQVLVSIQSLILVENPYYNEPGWERQMHTEEGREKNFAYTDNIRLRNLQWGIIDKLKNPTKGFENFIQEHFRMKKDEIFEIVNKWKNESIKYKSYFEKSISELKELYQKFDANKEICKDVK